MERACDRKNREKSVRSICCLGCGNTGMYTCWFIASMCSNIKVTVVDMNEDKVVAWNTKTASPSEPGFEEILRKCQNRNLIFSTETEYAIREADIIFLSLDITFTETGKFRGIKTAKMEEAARLIAKVSGTNKIVVETNTMPVGCCRFLSYVLEQNKEEKVKFQVLSNPDFCSAGEVLEYMANPDRILIGSNMSAQGLAAANVLQSIYTRWVPQEKILLVNTWSSELGKLATNAFLAQKLSAVSALSLVCKEIDGVDITEILRIYSEITGNSKYLEPSFRFGGKNLQKDLMCLIFMCRELKLTEMADYWQDVLNMNDFHMNRFKKIIVADFYETLVHKKIAILGLAYKKGVVSAANSSALLLCKSLLSEGANLTVYDPAIEKRHIVQELKNLGCSEAEANLMVADDAYKAANKANAIVCCTDWDDFKNLDFAAIYKNMVKPAYVFDGRKFLPHQTLMDMDFIVRTIGTNLQQKQLGRKTNSHQKS